MTAGYNKNMDEVQTRQSDDGLWEDRWEFDTPKRKARAALIKKEAALRNLHQEASDENTTGPRLQAIVEEARRRRSYYENTAHEWIVQAAFANPNIPPRVVLDYLNAFHPAPEYGPVLRAFFSNPVVPLLPLEMPDFVSALKADAQIRVLREETLPVFMAQQLAQGHGEIAEAAQMHVALAGETENEAWPSEVRAHFQTALLHVPKKTAKKMHLWHAELADLYLAPKRIAGPSPPILPPLKTARLIRDWFACDSESEAAKALLRRIAPHRKQAELAHALRAGATPADLKAALLVPRTDRDKVTKVVFYHPSVSGDLIRSIYHFDPPVWERSVVSHPLTPSDVLEILLGSSKVEIRRAARLHPNAPPNANEIATKETLARAKSAHAGKPSAFVYFVAKLHQEKWMPSDGMTHWLQRLIAALFVTTKTLDASLWGHGETRTGRDLLHHLSHDGNRIVRAAARTKLENPAFVFVW